MQKKIGVFALMVFFSSVALLAFNNPTLDPRKLPPRNPETTQKQEEKQPKVYGLKDLKLSYVGDKEAVIITKTIDGGGSSTNTTASRGSIPIFQSVSDKGILYYENDAYTVKIKDKKVELWHDGKIRAVLAVSHSDTVLRPQYKVEVPDPNYANRFPNIQQTSTNSATSTTQTNAAVLK